MSLAMQISSLVEQLPEKNQILVLELVRAMIPPDDRLTDEDVADLRQARAEIAGGDYVRHEDIDWN